MTETSILSEEALAALQGYSQLFRFHRDDADLSEYKALLIPSLLETKLFPIHHVEHTQARGCMLRVVCHLEVLEEKISSSVSPERDASPPPPPGLW